LSPDGSQLAFVGALDESQVWLRAMSELEARPLRGTEGANSVFWSPDGRSLAFLTADALKRIDLPAGAAVTISEVPAAGLVQGTWGSRGTILLGLAPGTAMYSVPAGGGALREVMKPDRSKGEAQVHWPWFLPDGDRFLYTVRFEDGDGELRLGQLDGTSRPILRASSNAQWIDPDTIVFVREGVLMGQRVDPASFRPIGEPFTMAQPIDYFFNTSCAMFSASRTGAIAHHAGGARERMIWVDQQGSQIGTVGAVADYDLKSFRFSRDGTMLLAARTRPALNTYDLWRLDLARHTEERLTADRGSEVTPVLIDDERAIVYAADRGASVPQLTRKDLATGVEQALLTSGRQHLVMDVFPDDRAVAYIERSEDGIFDIFQLPLAPGSSPTPILRSPLDKPEMRLSPDGRAMTFVAMEGPNWDLHVVSLPVTGPSVVVAAAVKSSARWSADGRRLYYVGADTRMMALDVSTTPVLRVGMPRALFQIEPSWRFVDVSPDGRLLMLDVEVRSTQQPIAVSTAARGGASRDSNPPADA
jgi:Tol biopolymer transport system component